MGWFEKRLHTTKTRASTEICGHCAELSSSALSSLVSEGRREVTRPTQPHCRYRDPSIDARKSSHVFDVLRVHGQRRHGAQCGGGFDGRGLAPASAPLRAGGWRTVRFFLGLEAVRGCTPPCTEVEWTTPRDVRGSGSKAQVYGFPASSGLACSGYGICAYYPRSLLNQEREQQSFCHTDFPASQLKQARKPAWDCSALLICYIQ